MRRLNRAAAAIGVLGFLALTTPANADFTGAKSWFHSLTKKERVKIQDSLQWTGDYRGIKDGVFGYATYQAIVKYQKRSDAAETGVLDEADLDDLQSEALWMQGVIDYHVRKRRPRRKVVHRTRVKKVHRPAVKRRSATKKRRRTAKRKRPTVVASNRQRTSFWLLILP